MSPEAKRFSSGCVASPHYLASGVGLATLAQGGNAMDAAIATSLVLGVVSPYMCGYGGDIFAIVWDGTTLHGYNGSGRSSAAATLDAVRSAIGSEEMPARGPHSVTVPGAVEGWFTLLTRFGTKPFTQLAEPAMRYARDGFPLTDQARNYIRASGAAFRGDWSDEWHRIYGDVGSVLTQEDLARTIEHLCEQGPDVFYRGDLAEAIAQTLQGFGALIGRDDLAGHHGDFVEPIGSSYRDRTIYELPPNSQGVAALEALNIAEGLDLGAAESAQRHHFLIESMKLALADRDAHVTDPDHMPIDASDIASKEWASRRRRDIGVPQGPGRAAVGGTIYLCAADADGMLVSLIQSNYVGFGSGVTVPGFGINLQNRGSYFSLDPHHVNVVAPSKRTMHTLMPAIAFRDGKPWLVFGAMGGDGQAQTHLQLLTRIIDDGSDIQRAIDQPRWVVSPKDWTVSAESRFSNEVIGGLEQRGHAITTVGPYDSAMGHAHAIEVIDGGYAAATDPRAEGAALGF